MEKLKKISVVLIYVLISSLIFAGFAGSASAATLSRILTAGNGSGHYDQVVSLPITVDDAAKVYGAAFTLAYDPSVFDFQGLEQGTMAIDNGDEYATNPAKYTETYVQNTLFFQANEDDVNGRVLIAVASAQELVNTTLLNAKFLIIDANVKGNYPITLDRTLITNPEAGYSEPTFIPVLSSTPAMTANDQGYYPVEDEFVTTLVSGNINVTRTGYTIQGAVNYGTSQGDPAPGCPVVLKKMIGGIYVYNAQTTVNSNGTYSFSGKLNADYRVYVTSLNPNFHNKHEDVTVNGADVTKNVVLPEPLRIAGPAGTVLINSGYLPGLRVKVVSDATLQEWFYSVNPDGSFMSQPLPPGNYTSYAVYGSLSNPTELNLSQSNPWNPELYAIRGTISCLQAGQQATIMVESAAGQFKKTILSSVADGDGDATYSITDLVPAADYFASAVGPGTPVMYFDQTTDISTSTAVDILAVDNDSVHFAFCGDKGTISGSVEDSSADVPDIGVFAFEQSTFALSSVLTGASGEYELALPPGCYEIFVIKSNGKVFYYADGGTTQNEANATIICVTPGSADTGINIDITECDKTLTGKVTYERADGNPVSNALIGAVSTDSQAMAITGQDGTYTLSGLCDGNQYTVEMTPLEGNFAIQTATITAGTDPTLNFIVDTGHVLSGTVKDSVTTNTVGNAMIYLLDQETYSLVGGQMFYSDTDGNYSIGDIPTGIYTLVVLHPLYRTYTETNVVVENDTVKDVSLVQGAHFFGQAVDGDNANAPLAGVLIIVVRTGDDPVYDLTDQNGNYDIYGLDSTKTDYIILAQKRGYVRQVKVNQTPATGAGTQADFVLAHPLNVFDLSGTIISGCTGSPAEQDAIVVVSSVNENFFGSTITDADGLYQFQGLPQADDYRFVVVPGGNLQVYVDDQMAVTGGSIVGGTAVKDVSLPCGNTIDGSITWSGASKAYVFLYTSTNVFVDFTTVDTSGASYAFTGLTPGNYKILAVAAGNPSEWYDGKSGIGTANLVNVPDNVGDPINIDLTS